MQSHRAKELFNSISLHFKNDNYDFFKYNGHLKNIICRENEFWFINFSRQFLNEEDYINYLIANFIHTYINENKIETFGKNFNNKNNKIIYEKWVKNNLNGNLEIQFETWIDNSDIKDMIKSENGFHPKIYLMFINKTIPIEYILCLKKIMPKLFEYWKLNVNDPILFSNFLKICIKYEPFLKINAKTLKSTVKDKNVKVR